MSTWLSLIAIGARDHRHGVPAHDIFDAALDLAAARIRGLLRAIYGVEIGCIGAEGQVDAGGRNTRLKFLQKVVDLLGRSIRQYIIKGFDPLVYFGF